MKANKGIQATNFTNTGNLAVGDGARATQKVVGRNDDDGAHKQQILMQLEELRKAIAGQSGSLENARELLESTDLASEELKKDKPNKLGFTSLLGGIAGAVRTISTVSNLANQIKDAAEKFL